ncbi:MAG: CheR family methyltransferase [Candidatus Methylomirabilales bacterium]
MTRSDQDRAVSLPVDTAVRPITDTEFVLFQSLIHREAGIYLTQAKRALLAGRLVRRLRELGLNSFGAYYRRVVEGGDEERVRMLDCVCTNETQFLREPRHFEFLEQHVFPEWTARAASGLRPRRIRVWSAACSTGEEPYSLAMTLWEYFPPSAGWEIEILATDLSTRALEQARVAVWPLEKAKEIPPRYLKSFMLRGTGAHEGKMKAGPEIRSIIRLYRLNLNDDIYPLTGLFDLIFCRNVLIYFSAESKVHVVHRLLNHLAPTGYLFLGHAESLNNLTDRVRSVIPTVYVPAGSKQPGVESVAAPLCGAR